MMTSAGILTRVKVLPLLADSSRDAPPRPQTPDVARATALPLPMSTIERPRAGPNTWAADERLGVAAGTVAAVPDSGDRSVRPLNAPVTSTTSVTTRAA